MLCTELFIGADKNSPLQMKFILTLTWSEFSKPAAVSILLFCSIILLLALQCPTLKVYSNMCSVQP